MYTTGWCGYCSRARAVLGRQGVAWTEINLEAEPGRRAEMIARSGLRTVPQIFVGQQHVGGAEELEELEAQGMLDRLLRARTG